MYDQRPRPERVRISKLQEAQIAELVRIDRAAAEQYHALGFDAAEVPWRGEGDFYLLPKDYAVRVAEADHHVAGYTAYRDEPPGVVYIEELTVDPAQQRLGIGTALLERLLEESRELGLEHVVLRTWTKAVWARSFYARHGFAPIHRAAPEKVRAWVADKRGSGRPFDREGLDILWRSTEPLTK